MSIRILLASAVLFLASCSNMKSQKEQTPPPPPPPAPAMTGGDRDEHGCIGSAGYTWSTVRNECIRTFEVGIRLNPKAANLDQTLSAFVVFKSDTDDAQAEIYMPSQKGTVILKKEKKESAGVWKNANLTLKQWKGMYMLEDAKGTTLYEGSSAKN
ncbi:MAG: hypothetical protein JNL70_06085 [Saprospiraceae bacterium]|nr:hypothetical protein [Saprospiraceae bacterium]